MKVFKVRGKIWALALSGYALPPTLNTRGLRFLYWAGVILSRPVAWSRIPPVRPWYFWNTSEGDSKVGSGLGDCEQISGPTCREQNQCCPGINNPSGLGLQFRRPIIYTLVNSPISTRRTCCRQRHIIHWSSCSEYCNSAKRQRTVSKSQEGEGISFERFVEDSEEGPGDLVLGEEVVDNGGDSAGVADCTGGKVCGTNTGRRVLMK